MCAIIGRTPGDHVFTVDAPLHLDHPVRYIGSSIPGLDGIPMNIGGLMQNSKANRLQKAWGDKPCDHPHVEKEYYLGAATGDYVCTRCGADVDMKTRGGAAQPGGGKPNAG
jgi:hypothetical protein